MDLRRLLFLSAALNLAVWAVDISGTWTMKVTSPQGDHSAKLALTQDGSKVTGSIQSDRGEFKIDGSLKGDEIEFSIQYTGGDAPGAIPFKGKIEGADTMKGQYTAGEAGGEWIATKLK